MNDYCKVLNLKKSYTTNKVLRKYKKLLKLIHSLKTNFKDAEKALKS